MRLFLACLCFLAALSMSFGVEASSVGKQNLFKSNGKNNHHHAHKSAPGPAKTPASLGPLFDYVNTFDPNYSWTYLPQYNIQGTGFTGHYINMTSQQWLTSSDVRQPIWWHHLFVIVPDVVAPEFSGNGMVYITGGSNNLGTSHPPSVSDEDIFLGYSIAVQSSTVVAVLFNVPNQPMYYWADENGTHGRSEDAMIAWAWRHYIQDTSDPTWLPRLPMTKAAVRAMDTVTAFMQTLNGQNIAQYIVAGASKRGWTTWTTGVVDDRVIAIIPLVLDELNFVHNIHHHYQAYCGWSFALKDYWGLNFTSELDTPQVADMMAIVDPISYSQILLKPKLILATCGDEFLLPDDVLYFWNMLQGEKHYRIFPNLEHSMAENVIEVLDTVIGFTLAVQRNTARPSYVWEIQQDGTIIFNTTTKPAQVNVWFTHTIDGNARRDFRLVTCPNCTTGGKPGLHPVFWTQVKNVEPVAFDGTTYTYSAYYPAPAEGWVGFVIETIFPGVFGSALAFSSPVSILPQTFPCPPCTGEQCTGTLL